MPQRSLIVKLAEPPTSLRRSPRLLQLQLKNPPQTPNPSSRNHPISLSPLTSSPPKTRSKSRSRNKRINDFPENFSKDLKKSKHGSRYFEKSASGSRRVSRLSGNMKLNLSGSPLRISPKKGKSDFLKNSSKGLKKCDGGSDKFGVLANGSKRMSRLSSGFEVIEGRRRSSRFRNEVNSIVDFQCNRKFDKFIVHCDSKSRRGLMQGNVVGVDNTTLCDIEASPVTPVRVGEKKFRGLTGDEIDNVTSCSCGKVLGHSEGRVLRSCSKSVGRKVEINKQNGRRLFEDKESKSRKRMVVRPDDQVRGISYGMGKDGRSGSCKAVVCGLESNICESPSRRGTSRSCKRKQHKLKVDHEKDGKANDSCKQVVVNSERMITRSASKRMSGKNDLRGKKPEGQSTHSSSRHVTGKAEARNTKKQKQEGISSFECLKNERQKRITRSSVASFSSRLEEEAEIRDIDHKVDEQHASGRQDGGKLEKVSRETLPYCSTPEGGERKTLDVSKDTKLIGVKRKRKQARLQGTNEGWTKEQEVALQRAYFTAKPSPHFWKRVSKLVRGKSAQECFDKVHSDNLTPLPIRPSSRAKKYNSPSDLPYSGSDLFKPAEKSKKTGRSKRKSNVARRAVRHLLKRYCHVNEDGEADLFSVLEPTVNPSAEASQLNGLQSTPENLLESPGSSSRCRKKCRSRLSGASESPLTSPPVLKKVKNMTLHEKYIDQLHTRETKRKLASARYVKSVLRQKGGEKNPVMKDAIRAAKDALVSDARDVINKFRHSQENIMEAFSDSEEVLNNDDEEEETVL